MLPPPGIFLGISPVDATYGDAVVNYRLQDGEKNNAPEGVRHSARGQTQQELTANYQAEVDKVLHSQFETARQLIVGYTPALYEKIGMPSFPLTIGSGHFYSAAKTEAEAKQDGNYKRGVHYHGLGDAAKISGNTQIQQFKRCFGDWQNAQRKTQTSAFSGGLAQRSGRSGFCHTGKGSDFPYTKCPVFFRERNVLRIPKYSPVSLQFRCCCGIVSCRLCCPEATQG